MSHSRWRLSTELLLWHSVALAVICVGIGLISYRVMLAPLEESIKHESKVIAAAIGSEILQSLWMLDSDTVSLIIEKQRIHPEIIGIRVETQFGDTVAEWIGGYPQGQPVTRAVESIYKQNELIGRVTVAVSSRQIQSLRTSLWPVILAITVSGIFAQFLLTWVLTGRLLRRPLYEMAQSFRNIARGRYDITLPESHHAEIDLLLTEARLMAKRIRERSEALNSEIAERQRIEDELVEYRDHLEDLIRKRTLALADTNIALRREIEKRQLAQNVIINVSTREQQRIGRDLHDTLGQNLVAARFMLDAIEHGLSTPDPSQKERISKLSEMLREIMEQARSLAHGLMIVDLREGGISGALCRYARKVTQMFKIQCNFSGVEGFPDIEHAHAVQLYLIAREAVNNAVRHGKPAKMRFRLCILHGTACLLITDNGAGFVFRKSTEGMGISIMKHRAESIGADLYVWSKPGLGTCVRCCLK